MNKIDLFNLNLAPEENNENEDENNSFKDGKVFNTRQELKEWVQMLGRRQGYVIVKKNSKRNYNILFACDRGDICKSQSTVRNTETRKKDCKFAVKGKYINSNDTWVLSVINLEHNHEPSKYLEGHAYVRRFKEDEFDMVKDLSSKNLKPRDILLSIKKENTENVSIIKIVYNARQKVRLMNTDGKTKIHVLLSFVQSEGYIYFTNAASLGGELQDLFFSHRTCLEKWRAFPHVIIVYATYKTNKYGLPPLEIVGFTSTNITFSVTFVLMEKEKEANYIWALDCLKSTLDGCLYPRVIVIDRQLALMNACYKVFPDAKGILCRWHIGQNITKNCRLSLHSRTLWDWFKKKWDKLIKSQTKEAYMYNLGKLEEFLVENDINTAAMAYLTNNWLTPYRHMFVGVLKDKFFNYGSHTSNKAESQHSRLKKFLDAPKCDLLTLLKGVHDVILSQDTPIKAGLENSKITLVHRYNIELFQNIIGFVSMYALGLMFEEYKRIELVGPFS